MTIHRIDTNRRMSQAVKVGSTIYLAGQLAYKTNGSDVATQMGEILERVERLLNELGSNKESMVSATVWLENIDDYDKINAVWDNWVPQGHAPARACVQARLAMTGYLVEVAVIAVTA